MRKKILIPAAGFAALLGVQHAGAAELIYGFDDSSLSGFTGNGASVAFSTTTGVTEGAGAIEILNKSAQTFGGAVTSDVPADFYNATSFNVTITITTTPVAGTPVAPVYFDLVPNFYSTDGNINPDLGNTASYVNLGGLSPGTYTYTVSLDAYTDPDGVLPTDATPGEILLADQAYDADPANGVTTTDAITGFQLTVEHGGGTATTLYADNVTVPSISVPEPASLGLLGTAGAFFLKRRKH